jgi:hypothetical protein
MDIADPAGTADALLNEPAGAVRNNM